MNEAHNPPPPPDTPARGPRPPGRRLGWLALWLPGALIALLLAGGVALWLWAATPGSLAQALGWADRWMQGRTDTLGQLHTEGVEGSLRGGGRIAALRWTRGALSVQAEGVQLDWNEALWTGALLGRGAHPKALTIRTLRVDDQRAPTPTEPLQALTLPLPLSLAFSVDHFELMGKTTLKLDGIRGHYRYGALSDAGDAPALPDTPGLSTAHRLRLDTLQLADGHYRAQLSLGGEAPMPLALDLQGDIRTTVPDGAGLSLAAEARARGTLAGAQAALDLSANAQGAPGTTGPETTLALTARVMPWAAQPLVSADLNTQALNLAALWPTAPATALSGRLQARPEGDGWRAQLALDNTLIGPADQKGLPLQSLKAHIQQLGKRWTVSGLEARLGGGELKGQGAFNLDTAGATTTVSQWQGELSALGIRPALLWSPLAPGALDGQFSAQAAPDAKASNALDLSARVLPSARQPAGAQLGGLRLSEVRVKGQWRPDAASPVHGVLELIEARVRMADAQLDASGQLDTTRWAYNGLLSLQVPGARLEAKGQAAYAQGQGETRLQLDSAARVLAWVRSLQNLPFVGESVRASLDGRDALRAEGSGSARLGWVGGLGALGWPVPPGETRPEGGVAAPRLQASVTVPRLSLQTGQAAATVFSGVSLRAEGPMNALQLSAQGSASAAPWQATLAAAGNSTLTPGAGRLDLSRLSMSLAENQPGDTTAPTSWTLQNAQPLQLRWQNTPATGLAVDAGTGELQLRPQPGTAPALDTPITLSWQRLVWRAQALETQGRLQGLSLAWIDALTALGQPPGRGPIAANNLSGDLVFDGDWDLRVPADTASPLTLSATLQRRGGDLRWQDNGSVASATSGATAPGSPVTAGVKDARISLRVQDREVQALVRWDTERLGQARADASSRLNPGGANTNASLLDRWWPSSTPISGTAQVRLPQVGVWSLLAPPGWRMSGTLTADATLGGTRGAPAWRGNLQGDQLALRSLVDGFAFSNGQLRATLVGDRISVDRFSLQGPGGAAVGGTLEASGQAEWRAVPGSLLRQPFIELQATAQRLRVSNRADRRLTLSGNVSAKLAGRELQLRGQLKADSALFILPDERAPSLDADVVVRTTRTLPTEASDAQRVLPDVSISLDLGPQFEVRGQGIQTRLEGQLTVLATPTLPTPRVFGEVRTASGTYRAYGQQLNIESGVMRFNGPYDDPALDIRAMRKLPENTEQRVGVLITGNAQGPRVGLFAAPDLPDGDKLAWLVLGRPASSAGAQAFVLQQAARQLLTRGGEPLDSALAKTLGLDEIGFSSTGTRTKADGTTTTDAALTLGKRLSSDLYLSYEQSVTGAMSTVSILYDLSKRLTLRARAGTENAIDLIFTHRYD
ncbi:MAG: translocation/assembly module TamB domain-containing protein [Hydrogenophaga sp.]|nr:translocation/assembly module TamB domain-containing protein [Hydrogenophaga sp.]